MDRSPDCWEASAVTNKVAWILCLLMVAASVAAAYVRPTTKISDQSPKINLGTLIPDRLGDWHIDESISPVQVSPDVQARLDKIYNQTLSRTYMNPQGYRIMLSIAYGGDQSDTMQVHRPEICYVAQGFQIMKEQAGELAVPYGALPIKRVLAVQRQRSEPITYWITVGDKATPIGIRQKLAQLSYGLTGKVPDGMLVRVSSIDDDQQRAYQVQDAFINDMLAALNPTARVRIAGRFGTSLINESTSQ
jgi:EpsI family protein